MFLIMSQDTVSTTTPPVAVVFCGASTITIHVTMAPTCVGLTALGQHSVFLPPQLILRDTMRGSAGITNVPQQQQPQSQMPSQA